jgi:hypothetical protein
MLAKLTNFGNEPKVFTAGQNSFNLPIRPSVNLGIAALSSVPGLRPTAMCQGDFTIIMSNHSRISATD